MLRYFCGTAALYVVLTLTTEGAFSLPLSVSQQPKVLNSEVRNPTIDMPLCYLQTADGRIVDLQQLCSSDSQNPAGTTSGGASQTQGLGIRTGGYAGDDTGGEEPRSDSRSD